MEFSLRPQSSAGRPWGRLQNVAQNAPAGTPSRWLCQLGRAVPSSQPTSGRGWSPRPFLRCDEPLWLPPPELTSIHQFPKKNRTVISGAFLRTGVFCGNALPPTPSHQSTGLKAKWSFRWHLSPERSGACWEWRGVRDMCVQALVRVSTCLPLFPGTEQLLCRPPAGRHRGHVRVHPGEEVA